MKIRKTRQDRRETYRYEAYLENGNGEYTKECIELKPGEDGVTDDLLLKEAQKLIRASGEGKKRKLLLYGPVWACFGAMLTAIAWILSVVL